MWQHWVNGILGLWVLLVPFLGLSYTANLWTLAISGIVVAVVGFWGAGEFHAVSAEQSERMHSHV